MTQPEGVDRLAAVLGAVLNVSPSEISDASSPETIASWDSLNHLNLVMAIEQEFAVSLSADDVMEMGSVAKMRDILRRLEVAI
jgi:acyl carrier protein